jgi:hypothetical protein
MKKKICYIIIFLIAIILGASLFIHHIIQKDYEKMISLCMNTNDEHTILECNYSNISHQTKYDMFYKHTEFFDQTFAFYFKNAETDCLNYPNECIVRELSATDKILKKCAQTGNIACLNLISIGTTDEDIAIFDKTISDTYQVSNLNGKKISNFPCNGKMYHYFNKLTDEQKSKLSKKTLDICNDEDMFYKKHPDMLNK